MFLDLNYFAELQQDLREEESEQNLRYRLDGAAGIKQLKRDGVVIHPLKVINKNYGFADYPEVTFVSNFPIENFQFKDSASIEVFCDNETPVKAIVIQNEGRKIVVRLYAPDFPEWIEDQGVGIKRMPDERTLNFMKKSLDLVPNWLPDFLKTERNKTSLNESELSPHLNDFQKKAILQVSDSTHRFNLLHGPPGTGKSTTLVELIIALSRLDQKIVVSAPSNAAVNHLTRLLKGKLNILRIGNTTKIDEDLSLVTLEGKWKDSK
ncbi:MAG: AAA family ATPase, partial [Bacteroidetes bacterium]|nr:AAA family ATPase [Bacteroidota bacterium]